MSIARQFRPDPAAVPDVLREARRWVVWLGLKERQGMLLASRLADLKIKYPVPTFHTRAKSWAEPIGWGDLAEAHKRAKECQAGVGFVLGDGFVGIDLDDVRDAESGQLLPWAGAIVQAAGGFTDISPSGSGVKLIGRGEWTGPKGMAHPEGGSFELYGSGRFFTVTGRSAGGEGVADLSPVLATLAGLLPATPVPTPSAGLNTAVARSASGGMSATDRAARYLAALPISIEHQRGSDDLYRACTCLVHGFELDEATARGLILSHFNPRCQPPWSEKDIDKKLLDAATRPHEQPRGWLLAETFDDGRPAPDLPPAPSHLSDFAEVSKPRPVASRSLPDIIQRPAQLRDVIDAAMGAMRAANAPATDFRFGDQLMRLALATEDRPSPFLAYNDHALLDRLSRVANWFEKTETKNGPERRGTFPRLDVVRSIRNMADRSELPKLSGWSDAPMFVAGGRLVTAAGYDPESGYYILPSSRPWDVPAVPTKAQTRAAVDLFLDELLVDFPFAGPADRANALALYLLPFCRGMIDGPTPLHVADAPEAGTGKTLFVTTWGEVVMGSGLDGITQPESEAEWGKMLMAVLRNAPRYVFLENVEDIRSKHLVAAVTNRKHSGRQLQVSEMLTAAVRCVWLVAGNNITQNTETARRNCYMRLDANMEAPSEGRVFKHELPGWAGAHRHDLITAALTIVRSWVAAGSKPGQCRVGSFEVWSQTMSGILAHAGVDGFMDNLTDVRKRNAAVDDTPDLFRRLWDRHAGEPFGIKEVQAVALDHELFGDKLDNKSPGSQKAIIRALIIKLVGQVKGGRKLIEANPDPHNEVKRYRLLSLNRARGTASEATHQPEDSTFVPGETLDL